MEPYGGAMDIKIELVIIPVSDVDRAKEFYLKAGFTADHDVTVNPELRFVQMTPVGSACSIAFGQGLVEGEPGSVRGLQAVVADIEEAHRELSGRGIPVSAVEDLAWGRFVWFDDPDGNHWALQQLPAR
jgi:catechol 2,3-dioxygenase-like lactoylglutathione lyase family enzyme